MSTLAKLWKLWKQFGQLLGDLMARLVLTLFYFTLFAPFALIVRLFQDPLRLKASHEVSHWQKREMAEPNLNEARRSF